MKLLTKRVLRFKKNAIQCCKVLVLDPGLLMAIG